MHGIKFVVLRSFILISYSCGLLFKLFFRILSRSKSVRGCARFILTFYLFGVHCNSNSLNFALKMILKPHYRYLYYKTCKPLIKESMIQKILKMYIIHTKSSSSAQSRVFVSLSHSKKRRVGIKKYQNTWWTRNEKNKRKQWLYISEKVYETNLFL